MVLFVNVTNRYLQKRATTPGKRKPRLTKSISSGSETLVDSDEEPVLSIASPKEDAAVSKVSGLLCGNGQMQEKAGE